MENKVRLTIKSDSLDVLRWLETQGNKSESIIKLIKRDIEENVSIVNHSPTTKDKKLYLKVKIAEIISSGVTKHSEIIKEYAKQEQIEVDTKFRRRCSEALRSLKEDGIIVKEDSSNWSMTTLGEMVYC